MVTRRIRSEYMKKFKDPKWETYTKCYEELLKYRLTRRLLEQTHNPWFWSGSDSDSDSGGRSPPPPSKNQPAAEAEQEERGERVRNERTVPRLPLQDEAEEVNASAPQSAVTGSQLQGARETQAAEEKGSREQIIIPHKDQEQENDNRGTKPNKSSKTSNRARRPRIVPAGQPKGGSKDSRHPFALYGSGDKAADIAGRKTHNVRPAASTHEIHESALRAKTRREVERQLHTQRAERRRAKSADLDKARKVVQPEFNPWLTEYMRCFSVRSR